jgi:hypothetical protein
MISNLGVHFEFLMLGLIKVKCSEEVFRLESFLVLGPIKVECCQACEMLGQGWVSSRHSMPAAGTDIAA